MLRNERSGRAVRRVTEGTGVVFVQSGLPEWWDCAMECFCFLRNVHDKMADGKTAFEKRHGLKFEGPSNPFGTMVEYSPMTATDNSRIHQFGHKTLKGILLDCALRAGRGGSDDWMTAGFEDLQESEASEIYVKFQKTKKYS